MSVDRIRRRLAIALAAVIVASLGGACTSSPPSSAVRSPATAEAGTSAAAKHRHDPEGTGTTAVDARQLAAIRGATVRFEDPEAARASGYAQFRDCFDNPGVGAMGIHFANQALIDDPGIDPLRPELLVYEPSENGKLELVALEYFVVRKAWHDAGNAAVPSVLDRPFLPAELEGLPPFYALHVWLWRDNPQGMFAPWNPRVTCL